MILDFSGTDDNFVVPEGEINIGISVVKGNTQLKEAFDAVLSQMTEDDALAAISEEEQKLFRILSQDVEVLDLSVRAMNCLNNANIKLLGELCMKTESRMLKFRNFGKKSLDEIKEKLSENNLSLGMSFSEELSNAIQAEADRAKAVKKEEA